MRRALVTIIIVISLIICSTVTRSCANTTTAPSGGPKDTIPPVLLSVSPAQNSINFPTVGGKIEILFDEYTIVKTPSEIIVSPPTKKRPTVKVKNKYIVVTFNDTLQSDRTYTIDFGNALADNNEGNPAPRFVYTFSTGSVIDSMYLTGKIIDSKTLQPIKGALVSLFSDQSDSACFKMIPDAATKSDEWGYFMIRNIKNIPYQLIAYTDADNNYKYDPDNDQIAFVDSMVTPSKVVNDTIYEFGTFIMKDTARCQAREVMYKINMFKELQSIQYLQNSGRIDEKTGFLKFSAADVKIKNFEIVGLRDTSIITQMNDTKDSMLFWLNTKNRMEDSLLVRLTYLATDSLGNMVDSSTNLSLAIPDDVKKQMKEKEKNNVVDTIFTLSVKLSNETIDQDGALIILDYPAVSYCTDSIRIVGKNPKGQEEFFTFTLTQDSTDIRQYILRPDEKMRDGYEYEIRIPQGSFTNIKFLPNKEIKSKFQLPKDEKLSILTILAQDVRTRYIVELMDEGMKKTYRKYVIDSDQSLLFPYVSPGKYTLRVTEDNNKNGIFDPGNFLAKRQPERVIIYEVSPGQQVFEIPERMDIEQEINFMEMFR